MEKEEMQGTLAEIARSAEELLQWAQSHAYSRLEKRVQQRETRTAAQRLEATVRKQGAGNYPRRPAPAEAAGCFKDIGSKQ